MKNEIRTAIETIMPGPDWLEIGEPYLYELLRECNKEDDYWRPRQTGEPDDGGTFMGVPIKIRKNLIGWRVAAILPDHWQIDARTQPNQVAIAPERGKLPRAYISSDEFDEHEQLKYEDWLKNRRHERY